MAKDPICGMDVPEAGAQHKLYLEDEIICFCSRHCQDTYIQQRNSGKTPKRKGVFSRFLEKLAQDNQQSFGGTPPKCH